MCLNEAKKINVLFAEFSANEFLGKNTHKRLTFLLSNFFPPGGDSKLIDYGTYNLVF